MSSELIVRISADVKKLEEGYKEVEKQTESLSSKLADVAKVSGVAFAAQAAAIGFMVNAYEKAVTEDNKLRAALDATGGSAGLTFDQLKKMGDQLAVLAGIDDEVVASAQTLLLTFNKISGETFPAALKVSADLSVLLGTDLKSAALQVGKALQDPVEGLSALSRIGIRFTQEQKDQIEAMAKTGQTAQAQAIILQTLESRVGGLSEKAAANTVGMSLLTKNFGDVAENIGSKFLPVLDKAAGVLGSFFETVKDNDALIGIAARLLTVGSLLSGLALAGATGALGIIKVRNGIAALELAFGAARVQAALFWGAATLGVATLITFLPEIITYLKEMTSIVFKGGEPKTLQAINTELERMKKIREDVNSEKFVNFGDAKDGQLAKIDAQIQALEKLKTAKEAANKVDEQKQESKGPEKNPEWDAATKQRLAAAKNATELLRLQAEDAASAEIELTKRKQDLILAEEQAGKEKVEEIRDVMIENNRLAKEQLIQDEQDYYDQRAVIVQTAREDQDAVNQELRDLEVADRQALHDEDMQTLIGQYQDEENVARQFAMQKAQREIAEHNTRLLDQKKFGTAYAVINQMAHEEEIQGVANAANQLVALTQSKNNTLKSIGKAAALAQIAISTAQGAISAYASLAPIPFVGPALGIVAAAALTAFGIERATTVMAAADGGMITGGVPGKDSVPALLMPGELVTPAKNFEEVVGAVRAQRTGDSGGAMSDDVIGLLQNISDKLDRVGNTIIQGDFYGDETFIDKLADKLYYAQKTRNVQLIP